MGEKSDSLYRPEIDGLRAIAVLAVVLFHAGVPYIDGGFLGVDVFFVISGFLITAIIRREVAAGTFSVGSFYERRAKRIIPALGVVLLACLPFAWLWMLPTELEGFSESVVATIFFVSNFFFWQGTDYFATAGEVKPLLHTWSLAVEEQYYALYPLFALGLLRFGSRVFAVGIVVALLMSLGFSEWAWRYAPDANFYLLPSRAWELLAGGLATFVATSRSRYVNDLLALLGLVTILAAIALFGAATPFPSLWGLLPVAGTCLVLAFSSRSSVTGYVLSLPPLVLIGGLSYSLYLWHQPVFAFARIRLLGEPSWQMMVCLLALCFLLSLLSWRLVENPVRAVQLKLPQMRTLFAASLVVLLLPSLLFSAGGIATSGYIARVPAGQLEILGLAGESYRKQRALDSNFQARRSCFADFNETAAKFTSACVPSSGRTGVMIWGDSFASAMAVGLRDLKGEIAQFTSSGCPPVLDFAVPWRRHCQRNNNFIIKKVASQRPDLLVLTANWLLNPDSVEKIGNTVDAVRRVSPATRIVVVGNLPQWKPDLATTLWMSGKPIAAGVRLTGTDFSELVDLDARLVVQSRANNVEFFSPIEFLCEEDECLAVTDYLGRTSLMAEDYGHITKDAANLIVSQLFMRLSKGINNAAANQ